jgi:DNA-binding transcriptional LysR family regulator
MLGLWRLQLLRELARRGTVKAAAEAMNVTPSAVSQQLSLLAREAGAPIVEKHGRGVRLTTAGLVLARHADTITGAIAAAEAELASIHQLVAGTLTVAAFPTAARTVMPSVMTALSEVHPGLRLTLRDLEADESLAALRMDEVDVALVDTYRELPSPGMFTGLEVHEFLHDPIYVALPREDGGRATIPLAELSDAFWILDTERSQFFEMTLRACRASGFEPHVRSNCKDFAVIEALVQAGLGVALLPGLAVSGATSTASLHGVDPPLWRSLCAVIRRERASHPAVVSMLAELDRFGASYAPRGPGPAPATPA